MISHKTGKYLKGNRVKSRLQDDRGITLIVVLMVMAILLSVVGAGLLFSGINTKIAMNYRTGTKAFNAADIGITAIASTVTVGGITPVGPTALGSNLCYRSGYRDPSVVVSTAPVIKSSAGYSLGSGTGYNASGYAFYQYPIAVTGSYITGSSCPAAGAETAARVVEAQAMYGPVSQ
jgi:hypothetical protein